MKLFDLKKDTVIHFIGVGGIGMSGLAEVLHKNGWKIQGSDVIANSNVKRLTSQGIRVFTSQVKGNIQHVDIIVISTAIGEDNPEIIAAKRQNLPIFHRSQMLAEITKNYKTIAVTGTHGKTTTTAMVYEICKAGGINPSVINGGVIQSISTNAQLNLGKWIVVEADESDGSFNHLNPNIAVITNIDPEHMEHHGNVENMYKAYDEFLAKLQTGGKLITCADNIGSSNLIKKYNAISYGLNGKNFKAENVLSDGWNMKFNLIINGKNHGEFILNTPGVHNVVNALAAIAVAFDVGISFTDIKVGLKNFTGVSRRFTKIGTFNGATVIDDYAHHPEEIKATLSAARKVFSGKIVAVIQPHRYTRLADLMEDFATSAQIADEVIVTPVYCAGEKPIVGVNSNILVEQINKNTPAYICQHKNDIAGMLKGLTVDSAVIFMGAGSITQWAQHLVGEE